MYESTRRTPANRSSRSSRLLRSSSDKAHSSSDLATARLLASLRLHLATCYRPGLGRRLLDVCGDAASVFECDVDTLARAGEMNRRAAQKVLAAHAAQAAEREHRRIEREGIRVLVAGEAGYPGPLQTLPDSPVLLFVRGALPAGTADGFAHTRWRTLGVVGSRRPSWYGRRQCRRFTTAVVEQGAVVVSGLARGIDAEAHSAAVSAGGFTIAVLGSGLGRIYPRENHALAKRMLEEGSGVLVSELPFDAAPRSFHFPMRNRILSGLSSVVFVVEAGEKSGSLITVDHALRHDRAVFVLPGRVDQPEAVGCLRLLSEGAAPATSPDDLVMAMTRVLDGLDGVVAPYPFVGPAGRAEPSPASDSRGSPGAGSYLLELFRSEDVWHPNQLAEALGRPVANVVSDLSRLELAGRLRRLPGGLYARRDVP